MSAADLRTLTEKYLSPLSMMTRMMKKKNPKVLHHVIRSPQLRNSSQFQTVDSVKHGAFTSQNLHQFLSLTRTHRHFWMTFIQNSFQH